MGSALDSASLIMYPSGYSDGVLGSAKPTDGSGDFTFTRGSNLSATRVGPNGYIEKGYENLLYPSNDFSGYQKFSSTLTSGEEGYDGTNDAWIVSFTASASSAVRYQSMVLTGVETYSIYVKAGSHNFIQLVTTPNGFIYANFDILNGIKGNTGSQTIDSSITSIGNGWFRISITANFSNDTLFIWSVDSNISGRAASVSSSGTYFIQDAMLNQGLVAYPYIETTTAPVAGGILEDEPRIDFSDGCGHLLLEPSRTNLVDKSEYFDYLLNGDAIDLDYNNLISPEGYINAVKCTPRAVSALNRLEYQVTLSVPKTYTFSMFAKENGYDYFLLRFVGTSVGSVNASFNLATGEKDYTSSGIESTIEPYANGWYRLSVTMSVTSSLLRVFFRPQPSPQLDDSIGIYTGDGTSGCYIYGLQLEQDATYPTSYIPTYGVSQTRLMDNCSNAGSLVPNNTEGTMFFDFIHGYINAGNSNFVGISGGNRIVMYLPSNSIYGLIQIVDSNGTRYLGTGEIFEKTAYKIAITYNTSEIKLYKNGVLESTTTGIASDFLPSGFSLNALSSIYIHTGQRYNQALLFPTALSDDECIALTTI